MKKRTLLLCIMNKYLNKFLECLYSTQFMHKQLSCLDIQPNKTCMVVKTEVHFQYKPTIFLHRETKVRDSIVQTEGATIVPHYNTPNLPIPIFIYLTPSKSVKLNVPKQIRSRVHWAPNLSPSGVYSGASKNALLLPA